MHIPKETKTDDNRDAANSLSILLDLQDNESQIVHNGKAALKAAMTYRPHVVILDIGLPDMSGYEVATCIRKQTWGKSMKIFALTGWGQKQDIQKFQEVGIDAHLVKPIDLADLDNLLLELQVHN